MFKTVDSVLASFTRAIDDLEKLAHYHNTKAGFHTEQLYQHNQNFNRARAVADKIKELVA